MLYFEEVVFTFMAKRRYTFVVYSGVSGKVIMLDLEYAATAEEARRRSRPNWRHGSQSVPVCALWYRGG